MFTDTIYKQVLPQGLSRNGSSNCNCPYLFLTVFIHLIPPYHSMKAKTPHPTYPWGHKHIVVWSSAASWQVPPFSQELGIQVSCPKQS